MRITNKFSSRSLTILALLVLASTSATFGTGKAAAAKSSLTFNFLTGSGPLCSLSSDACPDIAMAPNGDTVSIAGSGTLTVFPKSVTGSGTFTHKNAAGTVLASGTWTATQLVQFVSYGAAGSPLPASFFGGHALIMVTLFVGSTPVHTAILTVSCVLGNPPPSAHEGIELNVQDVINFNTEVSGDTLFIST